MHPTKAGPRLLHAVASSILSRTTDGGRARPPRVIGQPFGGRRPDKPGRALDRRAARRRVPARARCSGTLPEMGCANEFD